MGLIIITVSGIVILVFRWPWGQLLLLLFTLYCISNPHNVDPDLKFYIFRVLAHRWLNEVWDIECTQISVTFTHDWPVSGCDIIGVSNGSVDVANHQHCTCHDGMADQVIDGWVMVWLTCMTRSSYGVLQFNLMRVEIRELRPKVVTKDNEVLVHYWSRTNVTMVIF